MKNTKIKNLFSTPKRILAFTGISLLSLGILGTVSVFSVYAIAESASVGKETAVNNAYAAAGISSDKVDAVKAKFKFDDGKFVYDVEFYSEGNEYEYKVHSKNGAILEFEPPEHHHLPKDIISIDQAKSTALTHAGLSEEEVTFTKAKLDRDDGVYKYEIEFNTSEKRYEYDVNAKDGTILETEIKDKLFASEQPKPENLISVENAKENALAHSGLTEAVFTKSKLTRDNGTYVYEINFTAKDTEYKYKVSAVDGAVIKASNVKLDGQEGVLISIDEAKAKAIAHSGLNANDVRFIKSELDEDDGILVYDIEFSYQNKKYEYDINAKTGDIIESKAKDTITPDSLIGTDKAKEIAITHAGLTADKVTFIKASLDKDDMIYVYEIEFKSADKKYEYEVNAQTGDVVESSQRDIIIPSNPTTPETPANPAPESPVTPDNTAIDHEKAKDIAFGDAGIKSGDHPHFIEKDYDDGTHHFEVEFSTNEGEFKYEIDAETGKIREKEFEPFNPNVKGEKLVGVDTAKEKALEKFSINKEDVTFTKAKLENDDGVAEYEIEFIHNGKKHEASVNATTGSVTEFEID